MSFELDVVKRIKSLEKSAANRRNFAQPQQSEIVGINGASFTVQSAFDYVLGLIASLTARVLSLESAVTVIQNEIAGIVPSTVTLNIRTITVSETLLTDDYTVKCDATTGDIVVTLTTANIRQFYNIVKIDSSVNLVTLTPDSGTINGGATLIISKQWTSRQVHCDGTDWIVL